MSLYPILFPPGIYRNGTTYQAMGRWFDAAGVRFLDGTIRIVGGWIRAVETSLGGPGRGLKTWRQGNSRRLAAIGTPSTLWAYDADQVTDITPAGYTPGPEDSVIGAGYGSGRYGEGPYGATVGAGTRSNATAWSLDSWGDHLVALASHEGILYEWDGDISGPAVAVADAPSGISLFVTDERILVLVGADGDLRRVRWSGVESLTTWAPDATNAAGEFNIQTGGTLVRGVKARGGYLLLTTTDAHLMYFQPNNPTLVYGRKRVGTGCGLIGMNAVVEFGDGKIAWMSADRRFWMYDGAVQEIPCEIADYIFSDFNVSQGSKVSAGRNAAFGEVTFQYPSANSEEPDRAATWNVNEGHWTTNGQPARTAWADKEVFESPLATDAAGGLFSHEVGWLADGASRVGQVFLKSGPVELGNGDRVIHLLKLMPDERTSGQWRTRFATRFAPEGPEYAYGPYPSVPFTDLRLVGRQVAMLAELAVDGDARIGTFRVDGRAGGAR